MVHDVYIEEYNDYSSFNPGEMEPCVPWTGTFHEVRHGQAKLVAHVEGPRTGELQVNMKVDGFIELIPKDGALPTYTGSYREKATAVVVGPFDDTEVEIVSQFALRGTLTGSDGSSLELRMRGKVTHNGQGDLVLERFEFTCV